MNFPFSPKLRLAVLWPALIAALTASALLWQGLPRLIEETAADDLLAANRLLVAAQASELAGFAADPVRAEAWVSRLSQGGSLRLTLIRPDGRVIADSTQSLQQVGTMENHAGRPEVVAAMATGSGTAIRRSDTTGVTYAYAARTVTLPGGELLVVRLAQPISKLSALQGHLGRVLILALVAALAAMLAVSWWLSRRLFDPLSRVISGANRLASGDFDHRLEIPEEQELATLAGAVNRLASQVETQIAAAGEERDHLRAILASMSDGVLVTDQEGRVLLVNPAFRTLFGLQGDLEGKTPLELSRQGALDRLVADTLDSGNPQSAELEQETLERPQGRRTLALTSALLSVAGPSAAASPALPGSPPEAGCVVVARDITAFTRLSEMRRDFVANVSHELKTPLAAIRGYAETLRDGALDDREAAPRFLVRVLEQCKRLQALLDDLLTLSRLERPGAAPERAQIDLLPLARRAVETLATAAAERQVRVELEGEAPLIQADADSMERLLVNLLDNAVKYNRPGGRVTLTLGRDREGATIEVRDTGIGIPQESLPRIFERFYRVDKGRSRDEGGTGLGLAIVKHVVQLHGGRVDVESQLGSGSRFRVWLPLEAPRGA